MELMMTGIKKQGRGLPEGGGLSLVVYLLPFLSFLGQ